MQEQMLSNYTFLKEPSKALELRLMQALSLPFGFGAKLVICSCIVSELWSAMLHDVCGGPVLM